MTVLADQIREIVDEHPEGDPGDLALLVLARITKEDCLPVITEAVQNAQRLRVNAREKRAFTELFNGGTTVKAKVKRREKKDNRMEAFRPLFNSSFELGNGEGRVMWMKATVEQHRLKVERLTKIRSGIDETITRHLEAIRLIEAAGVSSLEELTVAV